MWLNSLLAEHISSPDPPFLRAGRTHPRRDPILAPCLQRELLSTQPRASLTLLNNEAILLVEKKAVLFYISIFSRCSNEASASRPSAAGCSCAAATPGCVHCLAGGFGGAEGSAGRVGGWELCRGEGKSQGQ